MQNVNNKQVTKNMAEPLGTPYFSTAYKLIEERNNNQNGVSDSYKVFEKDGKRISKRVIRNLHTGESIFRETREEVLTTDNSRYVRRTETEYSKWDNNYKKPTPQVMEDNQMSMDDIIRKFFGVDDSGDLW